MQGQPAMYGGATVCRVCGQPNHVSEVCPLMFARQNSQPGLVVQQQPPSPMHSQQQMQMSQTGMGGMSMQQQPQQQHAMYTASPPQGAQSPYQPVIAVQPVHGDGDPFSPPAQQVLFRQPPEFYLHKDAIRQQQISQHQLTLQQQQQPQPLNSPPSQQQGQQQQSPSSDAADGCCLFVCLAGVCAGLYAFLKCS